MATADVQFIEFSELKIPLRLGHYRPTDIVPIVRSENGRLITESAKWGFAPAWATGRMSQPSINARAETVSTSPKFRRAFLTGRCLMPTSGFYEPMGPKTQKKREQFYFHQPQGGVFAMAGIYTVTQDQISCALITTTSNALMAPIHDRMPVILQPTDYAKWLDIKMPVDEVQTLLRPAPDSELIFEPETPTKPVQPQLFD